VGNNFEYELYPHAIADHADGAVTLARECCADDVASSWAGCGVGAPLGWHGWDCGLSTQAVGSNMIATAAWTLVALGAGVVLHEMAHYVTAFALDRKPRLHHPTLQNPKTLLSTSFEVTEDRRDALVALAPVAAALPALIAVPVFYALTGHIHYPALALALACGKPSPSDIALARQDYCDEISCNLQDATDTENKKSA